ncbi:MAG: tRNA-uridine 2-sulfurtransferase [Actinomycetota bacterium]|nr:tRNA-uridine 2-sulfurtransferase [Actinomycetota bacterium]
MRVLAAMSGGVDSAVAAARALEAGHEVVGVHLALSRTPATERTGARGCCTIEDARDARRAADVLGIPFYVWDLAERFEQDVVEDFVAEYAAGRTPNPCVRCNERIKFSALLDRALALDFDAVCTGHYARVVDEPGGGRTLHRAVDPAKDQSYVLAVLTPERLRHALFPLGDTRKDEVRREAAARGLQVADKPDSHDICFIADGDTAGWLTARLGRRPGIVEDLTGRPVGDHEGAYAYTVGQRRGLRLGIPAADGRPRYVVEVRPVTNTVVVGPKEALAVREVSGEGLSWCADPLKAGAEAGVQVRAHGAEVPGRIDAVTASRLLIRLGEPLDGVAPGQTVVVYTGTQVRGAATISATGTGDAGQDGGGAGPSPGVCHEHP